METMIGCKWSLTVFHMINMGINRPGEMVRSVDGLSTKVLNQCLRKHMDNGILEKTAYPEIPPRVEYVLTPFGQKFTRILDEIYGLQQELDQVSTADTEQ